ncbi:MAG: class I SAM-dependent methyltransferase, partial [Candidatus Kapaibacterium sp.]
MAQDKWLDWIVNRRFGGDKKIAEGAMVQLNQIREKIIESASIHEGDRVLDIGTGDGFLGFTALEIVGPKGKVIFSDVSSDCVEACREIYSSIASPHPAEFIVASAENLSPIEDSSIDVIIFRSVLIYIDDKLACFKEFHRILKSGGRISFFEPINIFVNRHKPKNTIYGYDITPIKELWEKIRSVNPQRDNSDDPMMNFDEDDLFRLIGEAGFVDIDMAIKAYSKRDVGLRNWEMFYKSAPNPNAKSLEELVNNSLTESEKEGFISFMKPKVEGENT